MFDRNNFLPFKLTRSMTLIDPLAVSSPPMNRFFPQPMPPLVTRDPVLGEPLLVVDNTLTFVAAVSAPSFTSLVSR